LRRYGPGATLSAEAAQVERLRYVLAHGCKEGLVERLRDWPGISVVRALLEEEPLEDPSRDRARGAAAREQEPHAAPERLKKSPAPRFHAASRKIRRELYESYRHFLAAFREAAARLRAGELDVGFPAGSFPPAAPWVAG
jgi:hypothetical protein